MDRQKISGAIQLFDNCQLLIRVSLDMQKEHPPDIGVLAPSFVKSDERVVSRLHNP